MKLSELKTGTEVYYHYNNKLIKGEIYIDEFTVFIGTNYKNLNGGNEKVEEHFKNKYEYVWGFDKSDQNLFDNTYPRFPNPNINDLKDGMKVKCILYDSDNIVKIIEDCKITEEIDIFYLCQNITSGADCEDKKDYEFSYEIYVEEFANFSEDIIDDVKILSLQILEEDKKFKVGDWVISNESVGSDRYDDGKKAFIIANIDYKEGKFKYIHENDGSISHTSSNYLISEISRLATLEEIIRAKSTVDKYNTESEAKDFVKEKSEEKTMELIKSNFYYITYSDLTWVKEGEVVQAGGKYWDNEIGFNVKCIKYPDGNGTGIIAISDNLVKFRDPTVREMKESEYIKIYHSGLHKTYLSEKPLHPKDCYEKSSVVNPKEGDRVIRGRDWEYNNQDCDKDDNQTVGTVIKIKLEGNAVIVKWDGGESNHYGTGEDDNYHLYYADSVSTDNINKPIIIGAKKQVKTTLITQHIPKVQIISKTRVKRHEYIKVNINPKIIKK